MKVYNIKNVKRLSAALAEDLSELTIGMIERHMKEYMFEEEGELLIKEEEMEKSVEELESMNNGLIVAGMCGKNELECAFDNEAEDFVFWINEETK